MKKTLLTVSAPFWCGVAAISLQAMLPALAQPGKNIKTTAAGMVRQKMENENPVLLQPWAGPYGGVPPFHLVRIKDFKGALEKAMVLNLAEADKIAMQAEPPTFKNTIVALEKSGQAFSRVRTVFDIWGGNMSSPEFEAIDAEMQPKIAGLKDKLMQNPTLFRRIESVYNAPETKNMSVEQQRLVEKYYLNFVLAGARLKPEDKSKVSEINQKLAALFTRFSQNQLADENEKFVLIKSAAELDGLPQNLKDAAAEAATERQQPGAWAITNSRSSVDPFLTYATNRKKREEVWRMFINRGDNGDKNDNNALIPEILTLRAQRAKLLGYPTHAHWRLANTMAKVPDSAMALMESVWKPAVNLVKQEVADMQKLADEEKAGITIEPWDYRFYAEKVRKARYDLDANEIKPYLQLEKLKEGMFWVAGELFGLGFEQVKDVPVFHPDVQVWKVTRKSDRSLIGLWYFDPYAREGKRSGAWMNAYREQSNINGEPIVTIVSNNSNFIKGKPGESVLISWDDAETLFHEFGHALHGLCAKVTYPSLSGTNVAQDYVEFPSQVLERWLSTPQVLQKFALHYQTGKPIPQALVDRIFKASTFNQGFQMVETQASAIVDMKLHLMGEVQVDPDAFERNTLQAMGMPKEIVMRHRLPQFGHIFSSDEYSAGYYSYLWSDVLSADAWEAFTEAPGGAFDKTVAQRLYDHVFSVGNTIDPAEGYRKFRGRNQNSAALMRSKGLTR